MPYDENSKFYQTKTEKNHYKLINTIFSTYYFENIRMSKK